MYILIIVARYAQMINEKILIPKTPTPKLSFNNPATNAANKLERIPRTRLKNTTRIMSKFGLNHLPAISLRIDSITKHTKTEAIIRNVLLMVLY
jgi:hypothetical protein